MTGEDHKWFWLYCFVLLLLTVAYLKIYCSLSLNKNVQIICANYVHIIICKLYTQQNSHWRHSKWTLGKSKRGKKSTSKQVSNKTLKFGFTDALFIYPQHINYTVKNDVSYAKQKHVNFSPGGIFLYVYNPLKIEVSWRKSNRSSAAFNIIIYS